MKRKFVSALAVTFIGFYLGNSVSMATTKTTIKASKYTPDFVLPKPLTNKDAKLYSRIFKIQRKGNWRQANPLIKKLGSNLLLGHVQSQKYLHPTHYRSKYFELKKWLEKFRDHPEAKRIYRLALKRKSRNEKPPRRPHLPKRKIYSESGSGGFVKKGGLKLPYSRKARRLFSRVKNLVHRQRLTLAKKLIEKKRYQTLQVAHLDVARILIGAGWFYYGNDKKSFNLTSKAAYRSGKYYPFGHWYAGLAAYRSSKYIAAADHFQAMAAVGGLSSWSQSAAAFLAARANLVARRPERVSRWLRLAASHPRTFYGVIAQKIMGLNSPFKWDQTLSQKTDIVRALQNVRAQRALALLQVGENQKAERELRLLAFNDNLKLRIALLKVADHIGLPSLALRTAIALMRDNKLRIDRGLYPIPRWKPKNGFVLDRALVFAVMRQESAFKTRAKSHAGARGLMQLMPGTAGFISNKRFRGRTKNQLYDPALNLALGQKYLTYLLKHEKINGNVLMMVAAYNGGPGNLSKWQRRIFKTTKDPLMFIESMPSRETRDFVERVLSNLWIYRDRLGQEAPSLNFVAEGKRPVYKSIDIH